MRQRRPAVARKRRRIVARRAVAGFLVASAVAVGYWALRASTVFAINSIVVQGGSRTLDGVVAQRARQLIGNRSLLAVDPQGLAQELVALPQVRAVRVDRTFPHSLHIIVRAEVGAALVETSAGRLVVARSGRVIAFAPPTSSLPVLVAAGVTVPLPGGVTGSGLMDVLTVAVAAHRHGLPALGLVTRTADGLTTRLAAGDTAVILGASDRLELKLAIAGAMLRHRPTAANGSPMAVAYIDVSDPMHPALRLASGDPSTTRGGSAGFAVAPASVPVDAGTIANDLFRPGKVSTGT